MSNAIDYPVIDTVIENKQYEKISFSSKEDIYDFLWHYDLIFLDAKKGNIDALCVIQDFNEFLFENKQVRLPYVHEYINMQIGETKVKDCDLSVIESLAKFYNIDEVKMENTLDEEINTIVELNEKKWKENIMKKYGDILRDYTPKTPKKVEKSAREIEQEQMLLDIDWERKYGTKRERKKFEGTEEDYPIELKDLIRAFEFNQNRMNELKEISERNAEEKKELNMRINQAKSLHEDIKYVKDQYGIEGSVDRAEKFTEKNVYSYDGDMHSIEFQGDVLEHSFHVDAWKLNHIREVAERVLTPKQNTIFELYFFNGMKQIEVANLIGESKGNISRDIKIATNKVRSNLQ